MTFESLLQLPQYSLPHKDKEVILTKQLKELTAYHRQRCREYARLVDTLQPDNKGVRSLADLPYLPVGLFKSHMLQSVPDSEVFKVLRSSGTTGQTPSRIPLDRETARRQTVALSRIITHVLGPSRIPMLLIESPSLLTDRNQFSARVAGLLGMMNFGRNHTYALDSALELDIAAITKFLALHGHEPFLMFGFTFVVWRNFLLQLREHGFDFSNGILVHSGGWKKLQEHAVSTQEFRQRFRDIVGLTRIYNFYGMVEQVGSIFLEGEDGFFYPPNFGDVIVRDPITLKELPPGEIGVLQVLSLLPLSYPGHSLLTEDLGRIESIDPSSCGRLGKAFSVLGRLPQAEMRGCSDVIAAVEA